MNDNVTEMAGGAGEGRSGGEEIVPAVPSPSPADLSSVRQLVLRAHPDTVPELIGGETIDALLASVEPARAAYRRVVETATPAAPPPSAPAVPAGATPPLAIDPDRLPPGEKIRRGLAARG